MSDRKQALAWLAVTAAAFAVVAGVTVPWQWLPGTEVTVTDPTGGLTKAQVTRAEGLRDPTTTLAIASMLVSLVIALVLGLTPWGARLVRRLPGRRWWGLHVLVATLVLVAIGQVVTLPFAVRNEMLFRDYGLSTQDWGSWTADLLKGYAVGVVTTAILLWVFIGLAHRFRRWWLPASVLAAGLVFAGSFAYPVVVTPLFTQTTPMQAGPLRTSLIQLAEQDGVNVDDVLVADESRRTTALNAYVSGFGATKRIVVYDTLLTEATPDEVRLVVAHELGHADANDVIHGTTLGALGAMAGVTLLALLVESRRLRRRSSAEGMGDVAAVPLVLALLLVGSLVSSPLNNVISRAIEARADVHSLDLTKDPDTFDQMQTRLSVTNVSDPDPAGLLYLWFSTHPTLPQRLAIAAGWAAR